MDLYLSVFKKFLDFNGRAPREEYWTFTLVNIAIYIVLAIVGALMGESITMILGGINVLIMLITIIPGFAVTVRRLHDTSRSAWWLLISFIPVIGAIVVLIFTVMDSDPETNEYGVSPKAVTD